MQCGGEGFDILFFVITAKADAQGAICGLGVEAEGEQGRARLLPSIMPYFAAACRSAISIAWKAGIAAEVLCSPNFSIGGAIFESKQYLLTDELFAWTLTVVLISVLLERATLALLRLFSAKKWQGGESV